MHIPTAGYKRVTGFLLTRGIWLCQSGIWSAMQRVLPHKGCLLRSLEFNVLHHRSYQENVPCMLQRSFIPLTSLGWFIDILIILPSIPLNLASVLYRVQHWFLAIRIQIWWDKFDLLWCKQPWPHKPCVYMLFSAFVQPLNFSVQIGMCRPMLKQTREKNFLTPFSVWCYFCSINCATVSKTWEIKTLKILNHFLFLNRYKTECVLRL